MPAYCGYCDTEAMPVGYMAEDQFIVVPKMFYCPECKMVIGQRHTMLEIVCEQCSQPFKIRIFDKMPNQHNICRTCRPPKKKI